MMFQSFNAPVVELNDGVLVRRAGLFYKKRILLSAVRRIVAVNRDALTHEETMVGFIESDGGEMWISEFDKNFQEVLIELRALLPGFEGVEGFVSKKPFEPMEKVLWQQKN